MVYSKEKVKGLPITGAAVADISSSNPILFLIIGILLGVIIFYVIWRYKNKEKYDDSGSVL